MLAAALHIHEHAVAVKEGFHIGERTYACEAAGYGEAASNPGDILMRGSPCKETWHPNKVHRFL